MSCNNVIDLVDAEEEKIVAMQRVAFYFILQFFLDDDFEEEDTLDGSEFLMTVIDKDGNVIITFSTETDGGLTIDNYNELIFEKEASEMDLEVGAYKYVLQRTIGEEVVPEMMGPFVVIENTNP